LGIIISNVICSNVVYFFLTTDPADWSELKVWIRVIDDCHHKAAAGSAANSYWQSHQRLVYERGAFSTMLFCFSA